MDGYDVTIEEIRSCGRDATTVGEETGQVDLPGAVSGLASAMPASASAEAAGTLRTAWRARVRELGAAVDLLGVTLGEIADRYAGDEEAARAHLERVDPRERRHR